MWGSMCTNKLDEENIFTVYLLLPEIVIAPWAKLGITTNFPVLELLEPILMIKATQKLKYQY